MTTMASQFTSVTVVYSTVYSDADQRKHQSSASLAFVWGIHRDRWIPRTKGQLRGKRFHLMTSSWIGIMSFLIDPCNRSNASEAGLTDFNTVNDINIKKISLYLHNSLRPRLVESCKHTANFPNHKRSLVLTTKNILNVIPLTLYLQEKKHYSNTAQLT